jgi:hypothetical protein
MNPQTQLEARRVLEVLDGLIADVECVAFVPPPSIGFAPADAEKVMSVFARLSGEDDAGDVQTQLVEHGTLENRLDLPATRAGVVVVSNSGTVNADGPLDALGIEDLHLSTRALVETLQFAGYGATIRPTAQPSPTVTNFCAVLKTLRHLLQARFETTVEEDVAKFNILNDTVNREKTASADVQALNREFHSEKESRRVEVEKRNVAIRRLRDELRGLTDASEAERAAVERAAADRHRTDAERYKGELETLQQQMDALERDVMILEERAWKEEVAERQQRNKLESGLQQTIDAYDRDMSEAATAITSLQSAIDHDTDAFRKADLQLQILSAEADAYRQEQQLEADRKAHTEVIGRQMNDFARVVQAFYRAHALRVAQANLAAKGKKGKKKRSQSIK